MFPGRNAWTSLSTVLLKDKAAIQLSSMENPVPVRAPFWRKSSSKCERNTRHIPVVYHAAGASPASITECGLFRHLCQQLEDWSLRITPLKESVELLEREFLNRLNTASREEPIAVIVDNIDWIEHVANRPIARWLVERVPKDVILILGIRDATRLANANVRSMNVGPMSAEQSRALLESLRSRVGKRLSTQQLELALNKQDSYRPEFITQFVREIQVYGYWDTLNRYITDLPGTLPDLYALALASLETDHGTNRVVSFYKRICAEQNANVDGHQFGQEADEWLRDVAYDQFFGQLTPPDGTMQLRPGDLRDAVYRRYFGRASIEG